MKTTIELPDQLAREAKRVAAESGTSLKSLLEEALRNELDRRTRVSPWQPRADLAFGAGGLTAHAQALTWAQIREESMERAQP